MDIYRLLWIYQRPIGYKAQDIGKDECIENNVKTIYKIINNTQDHGLDS